MAQVVFSCTARSSPASAEEKLKKILDETRPLELAFVKDKAGRDTVQHGVKSQRRY